MPSDKVEITQKELDEVYIIKDAEEKDAEEEEEDAFLTEEEKKFDDKLADTLNWNEEKEND